MALYGAGYHHFVWPKAMQVGTAQHHSLEGTTPSGCFFSSLHALLAFRHMLYVHAIGKKESGDRSCHPASQFKQRNQRNQCHLNIPMAARQAQDRLLKIFSTC